MRTRSADGAGQWTFVPEAMLVAVLAVAAVTIAGPATPCQRANGMLCQWSAESILALQQLCVGQYVLLSSMPILIGLLSSPGSRFLSGAHLPLIGVLGWATCVLLGLEGIAPRLQFLQPVAGPLLTPPLLASLAVILALRFERLARALVAQWGG